MNKKRLVGYALTVLIALWGIVYYPLQCVNAVKHYTAKPLAALNYDPILPLALVPFLMLMAWLVGKIDRGDKTIEFFSPKRAFIFALWLVALVWPLANSDAKNRFLRDQRTWNGTCTISDVFVTERNQLVVQLKCANGTMTQTLDGVLINKLMQGKKVSCTTNATGTADCQP